LKEKVRRLPVNDFKFNNPSREFRVELNRNTIRAGRREIRGDQIDRVRIMVYGCFYGFMLGPVVAVLILMGVVLTVMRMAVIITMCGVSMHMVSGTNEMEVCPMLACRRVRSRTVRVSKGVAHY